MDMIRKILKDCKENRGIINMFPSKLSITLWLLSHNKLSLTVWVARNCYKFLKIWKYQTTLPASWDICIQVKKQQLEPNMEQRTGSNWESSTSSLNIVILLIQLTCKLHHGICMTGWHTSWNQDCREKYQ